FGGGSTPSWSTSSINANPLLVSATGTYDLHLKANSPAIGAGVNLTSRGAGLLDFDGRRRPTSGSWDIGAYQSGSQASGGASTASGGASTATTVEAAMPAPASVTSATASSSTSVGDTTTAPVSVTSATASSSTSVGDTTMAPVSVTSATASSSTSVGETAAAP